MDEKILRWVEETASRVCEECDSKCCNSEKHILGPFKREDLKLFEERRVKVYSAGEIDRGSAMRWLKCGEGNVLNKRGEEIREPSIIEIKKSWRTTVLDFFVKEYFVYTKGDCPLYEEGRCIVHHSPERPAGCREYPLVTTHIGTGEKEIHFLPSCKGFNAQAVRDDFKDKFGLDGYRLY
jgi:Fe-S-cluster containining protein